MKMKRLEQLILQRCSHEEASWSEWKYSTRAGDVTNTFYLRSLHNEYINNDVPAWSCAISPKLQEDKCDTYVIIGFNRMTYHLGLNSIEIILCNNVENALKSVDVNGIYAFLVAINTRTNESQIIKRDTIGFALELSENSWGNISNTLNVLQPELRITEMRPMQAGAHFYFESLPTGVLVA